MNRTHSAFCLLFVLILLAGCGAPSAAQQPAAPSQPAPTQVPSAVTAARPATNANSAPATAGTVHLTLQPDSQVGYRVREQLANVDFPSDAVGTTKAITGGLAIQSDGKVLSNQSKFTVDLTTLTSDKGMRDNYIKRNTLETNKYPEAVFVPTSAEGLPSPLPASGDVHFKLAGDLTVRGITKPVTWDVKGTVAGKDLTGTGTTSFKFEDFGMTPPTTMIALSVQDNISLEMNFHLAAGS